ncbi:MULTISPECIES: L,D-transpeptidase family protein [unclassified Paludibacterium]|uniref:L,D-transpeptidase family protein n=1 Tax=unclassified Paludibacterium TaxID=2618429 RepID=UPI001C05C5E5|nr:L,D-transpeptidase family protein [Paludibacterium sp. B53371]BEV72594.1 hypothetical protein THUN1379_20760 [Paludibacterium sp. THUN1379]
MSFCAFIGKQAPSILARLVLALALQPVWSATFTLPADGSTVVGQIRKVEATHQNTLLDIGRHFDLGYAEMEGANPGMSVWTPHGDVVVPTQFILPPKPWSGIVVNIPQRRLFFFPKARHGQPAQVITYPISIAQPGWSTPLGTSKIIAKFKDPAWFVPKSIQAQHAREDGTPFPDYFPPGPDNPMGMLAMQTGLPGIYIHGTNHPWGVGLRTSHGCMHLYPEDAAQLFPLVSRGTPVTILNQPVVTGHLADEWMIAIFPPVAEYPDQPPLNDLVASALSNLPLPPPQIAMTRVAARLRQPGPIAVPLDINQPEPETTLEDITVEAYPFQPYDTNANTAQAPAGSPPATP